jgi:2-dehydro-3-deoxyphosphogluconate aldolase/(4S)-4-hydroxy-2-oxoglutarate aldolase
MALDIKDVLSRGPVVPVIVLQRAEDAVPLAEALLAGGCRVAEITLRTGAAVAGIDLLARRFPEMAVGAGTLKSRADVYRVQEAGAMFGVSPGLTDEIHRGALESGLPLLPGVCTPSEVLHARSLGYRQLKFFPAEQAGGVPMLKAWVSVFDDMQFCPTGGITAELAPSYLALPNVTCVGGSWLVDPQLIAQGNWAQITQLTQQAMQLRATVVRT